MVKEDKFHYIIWNSSMYLMMFRSKSSCNITLHGFTVLTTGTTFGHICGFIGTQKQRRDSMCEDKCQMSSAKAQEWQDKALMACIFVQACLTVSTCCCDVDKDNRLKSSEQLKGCNSEHISDT